jgi:hypothetical protein
MFRRHPGRVTIGPLQAAMIDTVAGLDDREETLVEANSG